MTTTPLIGRNSECAVLDEALSAARQQRTGTVLHLLGEAGIGKTALAEHAASGAPDALVLRAHGLESETPFPYSGLQELMGAAMAEIPLLDAHLAAALRTALGLAPSDGARPAAVDVHLAVLTLLSLLAQERPVLVLIDDLPTIDEPTQSALRFLSRRIAHDPIVMLTTSRAQTLQGAYAGSELLLAPLSADAARLIAERAGRRLPSEVLDDIVAQCAGNPLALRETLTMGEGLLPRSSLLDDPLPLGQRLRQAFIAQIEHLPSPTQQALILLAVAQTTQAATIAEALQALDCAPQALDAAEAAGVIVRTPGALRFRHPLLRAAAFHAAAASEIRACHRALSEAGADPEARAWHAAAAAILPSEEVAAALAGAAERFAERDGALAASKAFARAAELSPDPEARGARYLRAARSARFAARGAHALELLAQAEEATRDERLRLRIRQERISVTGELDPGDRAHREYLQLASAAEGVDDELVVDALCFAAGDAILAGRPTDLREALDRLAEATPPDDEWAEEIAVVTGAALVISGEDPHAGVEQLAAIGQRRVGAPRRGDFFLAEGLVWSEDFAAAGQIVAELRREATQTGDLASYFGATWVDGVRELRLGNWTEAEAIFAEVRHLGLATGQVFQVVHASASLALLHGARGDDAALRLADEIEGAERGHRYLLLQAAAARGAYWLAIGRAEEAMMALTQAGDWAVQLGHVDPAVLGWEADLAEAQFAAGHPERGAATVAALRGRAERTRRSGPRAAVARLEATHLADGAHFHTAFERALELGMAAEHPFEMARTQLAYGRRLRRAGQRVSARTQLELAERTFARLGASGWLAQVGAELQASGRVRSASGDGRTALTSQELLVVRCVLRGMTNRETAAQLYLTPKTVEWHLRQVFRKLGIRSRVQLAGHFPELTTPSDE